MKKTSIDITQENSKFRILLNKKIQKTKFEITSNQLLPLM